MTQSKRPIIGITMGDAAGIGPEITNKVFSLPDIYQYCRPLVIGDAGILLETQRQFHTAVQIRPIENVSEANFAQGVVDVIDLGNIRIEKLRMGESQPMAGRASFEYIKKAAELALQGKIDAITTAPISKQAMKMAGLKYPGHTEILAELTHTKNFAMMFIAGQLRVILVTIHVSLRKAIGLVKKNKVLLTIRLAQESMRQFGIIRPRVVVAGLNPHAGESGMFGSEDADEIAPAVRKARRMGINVIGPLPADTIFYRANKSEFDIVVAMYHDQGLIPIKLLGFERGVNITVGLPIVRTSPDHGTAYDLARQRLGTANPSSLLEAIKIASRLSR